VPDAYGDGAMRIFADEFLGVGTGLWVRRAVGGAFKGNRGHGYDRTGCKPFFDSVIFWFAFS
jgi:hypothetical protein